MPQGSRQTHSMLEIDLSRFKGLGLPLPMKLVIDGGKEHVSPSIRAFVARLQRPNLVLVQSTVHQKLSE